MHLSEACQLVLKFHPDLRTIPWDRRVADARRVGAARLPNPTLEVEAEDFGGTGPYQGSRSTIYTSSIVQVIETGGKRAARRDKAAAFGELVEAEHGIRRREVVVETSRRFVAALAGREMLKLAERELASARAGRTSVEAQIEAGRATESELRQAEMVSTRAELTVRRAQRDFEQALAALSAQWGCRGTQLAEVSGILGSPPRGLPSRAAAERALDGHPALAAARGRRSECEAGLRLARAGRAPNVELAAGARHDNASDDQAFVLGASVPLPIFDDNRAAVREAEAELSKAELAIGAARLDLATRFDAAWTELANAHDAAVTVETSLLPKARQVFDKTSEAYELGSAGFLERLEARRQLDAASRDWIEARRDYQLAAARLQGLTGKPL